MKKSIKISLLIILVIALFTACSYDVDTNPIVGTVPENEIPSEPKLHHYEKYDDFEDMKAKIPIKSIMGLDNEELSVDSAVGIADTLDYTDYPDKIVYDHSYFVYNSSDLFTVKKGDKLKNGLVCTDAETAFEIIFNEDLSEYSTMGYFSDACFSGELDITGELICVHEDDNDPFLSVGDLVFFPDADNKNVPGRYSTAFSYDNAGIDEDFLTANKQLRLGNISDLSEENALLIKDNRSIHAQVTVKDIHLSFSNYKTDLGSYAVLESVKVI